MPKVKNTFPKFYVCRYGCFYEGEEVEQYCRHGANNFYFNGFITIEKFIVHYDENHQARLYFRIRQKGYPHVLPVEQLGILYRKIKKKA